MKNFASQTLPTLEDHLKQAKEVNGKTSGTASSAKSSSKTKKSTKSSAMSEQPPVTPKQ